MTEARDFFGFQSWLIVWSGCFNADIRVRMICEEIIDKADTCFVVVVVVVVFL